MRIANQAGTGVDRSSAGGIDRFAAGIAHEIGNPLAAASRVLEGLVESPRLTADERRLVALVHDELSRAGRIARDVLAWSRPSRTGIRAVDLSPLLESAAILLRHEPRLPRGVTVRVETAGDLPAAAIDGDRIRQVLWNLCLNACAAVPAGGRIVLAASRALRRKRDGVRIEVRDSGPGVPEPLRERAFRAFETTRVDGSGLGLAISRRTARWHGGALELGDAPEGGACAALWLPLAPIRRAAPSAAGGG